MPSSGDSAPEFSLVDQHGETTRLADLAGRKVLVHFDPKTFTICDT